MLQIMGYGMAFMIFQLGLICYLVGKTADDKQPEISGGIVLVISIIVATILAYWLSHQAMAMSTLGSGL